MNQEGLRPLPLGGGSDMEYIMTRRLVRASGGSIKVNLDPCFPFKAGDVVTMRIEALDDPRCYEGERPVYKSGNSMSAVIPLKWGFKIGDMVRVTVTRAEDAHDDSRRPAQEGYQVLPELQRHLLGDSPRRGVREVGGPRPHRLLQGDVRRAGGEDVRRPPEPHTGGPPEGDRGVGRRLRHSPQPAGGRGRP